MTMTYRECLKQIINKQHILLRRLNLLHEMDDIVPIVTELNKLTDIRDSLEVEIEMLNEQGANIWLI